MSYIFVHWTRHETLFLTGSSGIMWKYSLLFQAGIKSASAASYWGHLLCPILVSSAWSRTSKKLPNDRKVCCSLTATRLVADRNSTQPRAKPNLHRLNKIGLKNTALPQWKDSIIHFSIDSRQWPMTKHFFVIFFSSFLIFSSSF